MLPESAQRVQQALAAAGIETKVVELPDAARTAAQAAAALGCRVAEIAKSLIFRRTDTGSAVLVIASGDNRVDEAKVAAHLGAAIGKADANFVRAATGSAIGGVPPLGHASRLETLIDEDILRFDTLWAAGGTPHTVFPVKPAELVRVTGGRVLALAEKR